MEITKEKVNSYKAAFALLKKDLEKRTVDLEEKHFVIVPDNCTLYLEKMLFSGGGAFDVEILTFNRLFSKLVKIESYLPRHGAVMLLKKVILQNEKALRFFTKSAGFKGFADKMYDTVSALISCKISPSDLRTEDATGFANSFKLKINDIKFIYSKYLEACEGKYIDASGRMQMLISELSCRSFNNVHFYFAGFDNFTKQESRIAELLAYSALSAKHYVAEEPQFSFDGVELYCAGDKAQQLKAAAKRMRALAKDGAKYGEMAVIAPHLGFSLAKRILSEFDIPFYADKKLIAGEQTLAQFFRLLVNITQNGYRQEDFIALSKNFYSGIAKGDSDIFENYCQKFCIDYAGFFNEFTLGASKEINNGAELKNNEELSISEGVRKTLYGAAVKFAKGIKDVNSAAQFAVFFENVFSQQDIYIKTEKLSGLCGIDLAQVPDKILQSARLLEKIFASEKVNFKELFDLLEDGLNSARISLLPPDSDVVTIGDGSSLRACEYKYVFVIGFNEGEIPHLTSDCAIITDADIDALTKCGVNIEPKVSSLNDNAALDFLFSVSGTQKLFLAYSDSGDSRISSLSALITPLAKKWSKSSAAGESLFLQDNALLENAQTDYEKNVVFERIARHISSDSSALEMLILSEANIKSGGRYYPFHSELYSVLGSERVQKFASYGENSFKSLASDCGIFFYNNTTTISKIQDYFLCPYMNFLKNGLKLSDKEDGRLSVLDIGIFLHGVMEKFVAKNEFNDIKGSVDLIIDTFIKDNEKYRLDTNLAVYERLKFEAHTLAPIIARQITYGLFECKWLEKDFPDTGAEALDTLKFFAGGSEISLRGTIDRVDVYKNFARVIDYKSGGIKNGGVSFTDLFFGKKIQLMIYMQVLRQSGFIPAGMFYFPLSVSWNDDEFSHRLAGVYNGDPDVLIAMDTNLKNPGYKSEVISARRRTGAGELTAESFDKKSFSFSSNELAALSDYAFAVLTCAADEIAQGYINAFPMDNACSFCAYKSVCRFDEAYAICRTSHKVTAGEIINIAGRKKDG